MRNTLKILTLLLPLGLVACGSPAPAPAPAPEPAAPAGWQVKVTHPGKPDMLCYAGATPIERAGTMENRASKPYLLATRRNSGKIELSASSGFAYMPGSKVELALDDETYSLFYKGSVGWARDDEDDMDIVEGLKDADHIELRGLSQDGHTSVDRYTSQGFAQAIERIRELCP